MEFPEYLKNENPENLLKALQYFFDQGKVQTVIIGDGLVVKNAREPIFLGGSNNTVNANENNNGNIVGFGSTKPLVWGVDGFDTFEDYKGEEAFYEIKSGLSSLSEAMTIARQHHQKLVKSQEGNLRDKIFIVQPDSSRVLFY